MSWLFSQALVEDCLHRNCLGGERSALLNWTGTADAFWSPDRMTEYSDILSRYGMTFVLLTADRGAAELMLSLEAFLASLSAQQQPGKIMPMIFGRKCSESWQMSLPNMSLPKMYQNVQSTKPATILNRWVTKPMRYPLARQTWALTTYGKDIGYLHTPTTKANYCADSMQKWPACQNFRMVFGKVTPEAHEYLMGWPIGWSDLKPLVTAKFLSWQSTHYGY